MTDGNLPSTEDMKRMINVDENEKNKERFKYPSQQYAQLLSNEAKIPAIEEVVYKMVRDVIKSQALEPTGFLLYDYVRVNAQTCTKTRSVPANDSMGRKLAKFLFSYFNECPIVKA